MSISCFTDCFVKAVCLINPQYFACDFSVVQNSIKVFCQAAPFTVGGSLESWLGPGTTHCHHCAVDGEGANLRSEVLWF